MLIALPASEGGQVHAVAVDAKRRLVIDGGEEQALRLCPEVLYLCGGRKEVEIRSLRIVVPDNQQIP